MFLIGWCFGSRLIWLIFLVFLFFFFFLFLDLIYRLPEADFGLVWFGLANRSDRTDASGL